jgi:hypothetical protein
LIKKSTNTVRSLWSARSGHGYAFFSPHCMWALLKCIRLQSLSWSQFYEDYVCGFTQCNWRLVWKRHSTDVSLVKPGKVLASIVWITDGSSSAVAAS